MANDPAIYAAEYTIVTTEKSETDKFLQAMRGSIADQSFVKLTLGKADGTSDVRKCVVVPVVVKNMPQLRFVTSYARKDVTEIRSTDEGIAEIGKLIGDPFLSATLFTTHQDVTLIFNRRGEPRLMTSKPTLTIAETPSHNRKKDHAVEPTRPYLFHLGVTLEDGRVKPSMYAKFKHISHFIEIVDDVIRASPIHNANELSVVDIGSGKGYLTFALYDFLTSRLGKPCTMTGIDVREDMVKLCSDLARRVQFSGLKFEAATAGQAPPSPVDLLVALHACDTATDEAIYRGVAGKAAVIIAAPCCQHELAPQLAAPDDALRGLVKFGLLKQRQADLITDAARALLLEASGYKVKIIEFVSTEHTAKNILLVAIRSDDVNCDAARRQYQALKAGAGFKSHRLEVLLASAVEQA